MKKCKIQYNNILNKDLIESNYKDIVRNTKHRDKIVKFDIFRSVNINKIYNKLKYRNYNHGKYNIFLIKDPKYRIIMSESIGDKIVNHLISNVYLKDAIYPKLIDENVATRVGMGTDRAIKLCKEYFSKMNDKYDKFYILKFDIEKYFYNIDHEILKSMLDDLFVDKDIVKILSNVIDSTDYGYINESIDKIRDKEIKRLSKYKDKSTLKKIEELKRIPYYNKGKGLGIGSLSNQIFAIFYLNTLDHFIKEDLRFKYYIRFVDDGILFSDSKEELKRTKVKIEEFLGKLKLNMNDKTVIYTSTAGFDFVGYRFTSVNGKMLVRVKNQTKNRMKHKFRILEKYDKEKLVRVRASYKGILLYSSTKSIYKKYFG